MRIRMTSWIYLPLLLTVALATPALAADNGTQETSKTIVRTTATVSTGTVLSRIAAVMAPAPAPSAPKGPAAPGQKTQGALAQPGSVSLNTKETFSFKDEEVGLASGDDANKVGIWAMGLYNYLKNDGGATKFDGNLYSGMAGMDYRVLDNLLAGIAIGYESLDLNTSYNNGSLDNVGYTIMPYVSYAITDTIITDAAAGITWLNYDASELQNGNDFSASYDAMRTTLSAGISKYFLLDQWTLSMRAGTLYSNEAKDSYTIGATALSKTDVYLGEASLGGKVAYTIKSFEPYVGANYLYDYALADATGVDRDEVEGVIGFNYQAADNLRFTLEGANSFDREDTTNTRALFSLRYEF